MITGRLDARNQAIVEITVLGRRMSVPIEAILDTGFDGDLCMPVQIAIQLGLELCGLQRVELADGSRKNELVFAGIARFGECQGEVEIALAESKDTLIGTHLLLGHVLEIDYVGKTVQIIPKERV